MTILIREGSVVEGSDALRRILDREHLAVPRALHGRPQPARHRRGRPSRQHDPHADIATGARRCAVYRAARSSARAAFGLNDRGLVAPGWRADIVAARRSRGLRGLRRRRRLGAWSTPQLFATRQSVAPVGPTASSRPVAAAGFRRRRHAAETPVIGIIPGKIITAASAPRAAARGGLRPRDPAADIVKVAVVARHGINRNIGGLRQGLRPETRRHRLVGRPRQPQHLRGRRGRCRHRGRRQPACRTEGGFVVVADGEVLAEIALPIAGLMSDGPSRRCATRSACCALRRRSSGHARGTLPAGGVPAAAGHPAPQDHRFRARRRGHHDAWSNDNVRRFSHRQITTPEAVINLRHGGSGSPLSSYTVIRRPTPCGIAIAPELAQVIQWCARICAVMATVQNRRPPPITSPIPNEQWPRSWWRSCSDSVSTGSPSSATIAADAAPIAWRSIIRTSIAALRFSISCPRPSISSAQTCRLP